MMSTCRPVFALASVMLLAACLPPVCSAQAAVKAPYTRDVLLLTTARVGELPADEVPAAAAAFAARVRRRGVNFRMDAAAEKEFRAEGATPEMLSAIRASYLPGVAAPTSGGILNSKAVSLPQPPYPPIAKAARAAGAVPVEVVVDESGAVVFAEAVSGHPLLRQAAVAAARNARFAPFKLSGRPVKVQGFITYHFVLQ